MPPLEIFESSVKPFAIPAAWHWVRLGDLVIEADAGWSPRTESFPRGDHKWGVLKVSAVSWDKFMPEENKQLLPELPPPLDAAVRKGDFLISRANTSELVAKSVLVETEPHRLILSDKIVRLQFAEGCDKKFISLVNNHPHPARQYYAAEASGTSVSMKHVSRDVIYSLPTPFPPLSEQQRIVAKVEMLMSVCDALEAQLNTARTRSSALLESVLHAALRSDSPPSAQMEFESAANEF